MAVLARLAFAESAFDAARLLKEVRGWLDFEDEDEARLYQCYRDWFYATKRRFRPRDWNPEREGATGGADGRTNDTGEEHRPLAGAPAGRTGWPKDSSRGRQDGLDGRTRRGPPGRACGRARRDGIAHERALLVRQATRRFGADIGRRLEARLRGVEDPGRLDRVGDLIVDCETAEQLLGGIDRAGLNSS